MSRQLDGRLSDVERQGPEGEQQMGLQYSMTDIGPGPKV